MEYENFEKDLLQYLKSNDKKCLNYIDKNKKLIEKNLIESEKSSIRVTELVEKIYDIILNEKIYNFKVFDKVLRHKLFKNVLEKIRTSNVLLEACKNQKNKAAEWLVDLDVNTSIQDENGMTALMYAAKYRILILALQKILNKNDKSINITDKNGNNALFHAVGVLDNFIKLLEGSIDYNQLNNNHETILMYCLKNNYNDCAQVLCNRELFDYSIKDDEGKTTYMYLMEYSFFSYCKLDRNIDYNYRTKKNESVLSIVLKQLYKKFEDVDFCFEKYFEYGFIIMNLIEYGVDFGIPIDDDGNSALMYLIMIKDYFTLKYIVNFIGPVDISSKNSNNQCVETLCLDIDSPYIYELVKDYIMDKCKIDGDYVDQYGNNLLMLSIIKKKPNFFIKELKNYPKAINHVNKKGETALIIAAKLCCHDIMISDFLYNADINYQDTLGNTALHYAIELRDIEMINSLMNNKANPDIKNNIGKTARDLAIETDDKEIQEILNNPIPSSKLQEKIMNKMKSKSAENHINMTVQNYRLKQYEKDYDYLKENKNPYQPPKSMYYHKANIYDIHHNESLIKEKYYYSDAINGFPGEFKEEYINDTILALIFNPITMDF